MPARQWHHQRGLATDERTYEYEREDQNQLVFRQKSIHLSAPAYDRIQRLREGESVEVGGIVCRRERMNRRDACDEEWDALLHWLRQLAEHHGADNVRVVVWFGE
jgi:hypothetical protein